MIVDKYQKLITKDIQTIIDYVFDNFDVMDKNNQEKIDKQTVISQFLEKKEKHMQRCCGVNQNGSRCARSTLENSMYCKIHFLKYDTSTNCFFNKKQPLQNESVPLQFQMEEKGIDTNTQIDTSQLKKVFIDDSFYYTDDKYMYDTTSLSRIGFVDENENYVLSNDPFILEN